MQVFEQFAEDFRKHGYNLVLQPNLAIRPLDLIASQLYRHTLIGPVETLIDRSSQAPRVSTYVPPCTAPLPPMGTGSLSLAAGRALLEQFVLTAGGILADLEQISDAERITIEYMDIEQDSVVPTEIQEFLRKGVTYSSNSVFREFVLSDATLVIVATVLKARQIKLSLATSDGKGVTIDYGLLWKTLQPDITMAFESNNEIFLEASRAISLAVQLLPLIVKNGAFDLSPSAKLSKFFELFVFDNAVLPALETRDTIRQISTVPTPFPELAVQHEQFREYVVLPDRGVRFDPDEPSRAAALFSQMHDQVREVPVTIPELPQVPIWVIDSISRWEPKRVRMRPVGATALNAFHLGIQVEPVIYYDLNAPPAFRLNPFAPANQSLTIQVVCASTRQPIEGAAVVAIVDWKKRVGEKGKTNARGEVHLPLGVGSVQLERLYVCPPLNGYWGAYRRSPNLTAGYTIALTPIDPKYTDAVRHFYGTANLSEGDGVRVAVIDCGVGPHPDLVVSGGENVVLGESDTLDNGDGHGTHVAGIIAGRGTPRGVAPGVELYSYRVVSANGQPPDNYLILSALIAAWRKGCDIANLSLGMEQSGAPPDETLRRALEDARNHGCLPVAAVGNSGSKLVSQLAKYVSREGLAISAVGRKGTYPSGSLQESDIEPNLRANDPDNFFAEFSNYGADVCLTAPGVGIISTVPNGGYGVLSGTSMAAPAVSGFVARIIQQNSPPLPKSRDRQRVTEIINRTNQCAKPLFLNLPEREGRGLPS